MSESRTRLSVRVVANSRRPGITALVGKVLQCKVQAPPVDGRANREMEELLARTLGVAPSTILVRFGHLARQKVVEITGIDEAQVFAILRQHIATRAGIV